MFADEELHRHAAENIAEADALLFGRVTYEMMEAAFRPPARTGARPDWMEPFARTIDAAKKYVVSGTKVRPGTLAERACMSKQAMNQLLRSLEDLGYVIRSDASDEGRARIVRFTKRGRAAYSKAHDILRNIEHEWSAELGPKDFAQLKQLLSRVWESPLTR